MLVAGLTEMHLGVHHAGQDMQAPCLEHLGGLGAGQGPDGGDASGGHADIGGGDSIGGGDGAAADQQIKCFAHPGS